MVMPVWECSAEVPGENCVFIENLNVNKLMQDNSNF